MPTNEERREVAARLREHARTVRCVSQACVLNYCIGEDECGNYGVEGCEGCFIKSLNRLADLIEPEPERTCTFSECWGDDSLPTCSACGWETEEEDCVFSSDLKIKYDGKFCKECGARVVE